jgi:hypothetical protein
MKSLESHPFMMGVDGGGVVDVINGWPLEVSSQIITILK